ncbi:MAG: aquaporin [Kofleriaceae bacterium]|nr:aquaporin [Kofleriaceae bacterium]
MLRKKIAAELVGTALLVYFAVGTATLAFGFGLHGGSIAAGVVMTALAFGLVLVALVYAIGPVSGCHVNPAVTLGFLIAKRISTKEALAYACAQVAGAIVGAVALWWTLRSSAAYTAATGLGADGWGAHSMIGLAGGGAFVAEVVLTFLFVLVVLATTGYVQTASLAGLAIGAALTLAHLLGIPLTGTSVNPARSIGPALIVGGDALRQLWLFIVAPLLGGAAAAAVWRVLIASRGRVESTPPPGTQPTLS